MSLTDFSASFETVRVDFQLNCAPNQPVNPVYGLYPSPLPTASHFMLCSYDVTYVATIHLLCLHSHFVRSISLAHHNQSR